MKIAPGKPNPWWKFDNSRYRLTSGPNFIIIFVLVLTLLMTISLLVNSWLGDFGNS